MRLNEVVYTNALPVDGYGPGFFRIGGKKHEGATAILPSGVHAWGGYDDAETLLGASDTIDVILVGTGAEIAHIPTGLRAQLEEAGIGAEVMATATTDLNVRSGPGHGDRAGLPHLQRASGRGPPCRRCASSPLGSINP